MPEAGTPLADLEWVPANRMAALAKLGLLTIADLIRHYPRRYEDRRSLGQFPDSAMDEPVCIAGHVAATAFKRFGYKRGAYEITLENESGSAFSQPVICRWFNMSWMQNVLMTGQSLVIYGKPKMRGHQVIIDHPEYEILEEDDEEESLHMRRIVPVHPAGEGITTRLLRSLIHRALIECDLTDICFLKEENAMVSDALRRVHFPESMDQAMEARTRLALDECYAMQIVVHLRRQEWAGREGVPKPTGTLLPRLLQSLPFEPTGSQREVMADIARDLESSRRMNRLLQGDVGSGKTLVALAAIVQTIDAGFPAAIMAPTQILAEQHHATFERLLSPLGIPVHLRTGSRLRKASGVASPPSLATHNSASGVASPPSLATLNSPPATHSLPPAVVGTHALLFEEDSAFKPGLIVIDEQHKFGVLQRAKLAGLSSRPDVLVMTATPIPRTLAQTFYGDLDVSILKEKPAGRGEIKTVVRPDSKLPDVADFIKKHLHNGRQAYIVYPLIDESEKLTAKAAAAEFEKWHQLFSPYPVGLIHGRIPANEKEATMSAFRSGEISVLVSTTVIEVGVDVPNASILLVENAERFGLAQLHQLRGRIGRGSHKSFCILLHAGDAADEVIEKLAVLERTSDGFLVAEEDLRLRGPGNALGTAQTGLPPLKLADLARDSELMNQASRLAARTLAEDPGLAASPALRIMADRIMHQALAAAG